MKRIFVPQAIACLMLLWALNPKNPYGYYILLRIVCCAVFAYLAFHAVEQNHRDWGWVLGVTAFIYNPILHVHLTREIWLVVNIATIVIALWSIAVLKREIGTGNKISDKPDAGDGL